MQDQLINRQYDLHVLQLAYAKALERGQNKKRILSSKNIVNERRGLSF
ncbi:hypothetical protein [Telluribacter humicola]|nr:hypothetical protein [Telluribacter humicola]